ncbi:glycosyltransferase, group 1 family protein [Ostertagia ostertagi]
MAQCADKVITVTRQAAAFFHQSLDVPQHKIKTIYNGILEPAAKGPSDREAIRVKYGFTENEQIILFSGRVKKEKGLAGVIRAFKIAALLHNNVRLLVAGYGDFADFIEMARPCWSKIVFTGELTPEEMTELYSIACIGILPSLFEQCSFTAIEMRFHQLPMIVSNVDGLGEVFEDGKDALVVPVVLDADGTRKLEDKPITEALLRLLSDGALRQQLAANGLKKARALFSAAAMQAAYLQQIHALQQQAQAVLKEDLTVECLASTGFDQPVQ